MDPITNVVLRDASAADIPSLAALHVRAFRQTHGGGPDVPLREQQWRSKFASGQLLFCILLEREGDLIGFASGQPHDSPELNEYRGELNKIYLLREFQRRGLGRRLLCAAAHRFIERGVNSMLLFGDAKSPSNGFYEAMGGERLHAANGAFHGGYGWRDLQRLASSCAGGDERSDAVDR
jgi:ribosomal protein S18 acetylase RimI-like enzyme